MTALRRCPSLVLVLQGLRVTVMSVAKSRIFALYIDLLRSLSLDEAYLYVTAELDLETVRLTATSSATVTSRRPPD